FFRRQAVDPNGGDAVSAEFHRAEAEVGLAELGCSDEDMRIKTIPIGPARQRTADASSYLCIGHVENWSQD
ncbi:hypothetical protein NL529_34915, partial [Klebsiella pneumoniae]|nr:hypothetical protein [Klebsiella pneumoniae]